MQLLLVLGFAAGLLLTSTSTSSAQDAAAYDQVVSAVNSFAYDFYRVASEKPGNLVLSPLSAATVLTLLSIGAEGKTKQELGSDLHLPDNPQQVANGYQQLMDTLQANDNNLVLRMADRLYVQTGFDVKESFNDTAVESFRSGVEELNFRNDAENARLAINEWVEQYTQGRITDLFARDSLDSSTVLVLVNAIYLRAAWRNAFQESLTTMEPFYISQSQLKNVSTMHGSFRLQYAVAEQQSATAVRFPYEVQAGSNIEAEMIILLPDSPNGLEDLEGGLGDLDISNLQFQTRQVKVSLPRFKIESTLQMNQQLRELGIREVFLPTANLSGISDQPLSVSQVIQKDYILVNENGTEAAAATGVGIKVLSVPPPATFQANHPFLFLLRIAGVTAFMGRVTEPKE